MSETHPDVQEYDGAYRCRVCHAEWGALPGNPTEPERCQAGAQEAEPLSDVTNAKECPICGHTNDHDYHDLASCHADECYCTLKAYTWASIVSRKLAEAEEAVAYHKRKAEPRPCIHCGYTPKIIKLAERSADEGE